MKQYIDKSTLVAEIKSRISDTEVAQKAGIMKKRYADRKIRLFKSILYFIDTLEVIDPYELCVQYPSVKDGIKAYAETYSFNIESLLFNQLTKEQQELWRKEIEEACISGGDAGVELARDTRYEENLEVKEVDLEKELKLLDNTLFDLDGVAVQGATHYLTVEDVKDIARHFYKLGLKAQKGE